jgi:hypothetical protein
LLSIFKTQEVNTFLGKNVVEVYRIVFIEVFKSFRVIPIFRHYSYIPSVDGNWGGLVDAVNNTFNGMIGMLQRKV